MKTLLERYGKISLDEMAAVKLMNRVDTKYVTSVEKLNSLLRIASDDYLLQAVDDYVDSPYYTRYFDTNDYSMYMAHLHGKKTRQKIRIRSYETSGLSFLEVKRKNNKGRTDKSRIKCYSFEDSGCEDFIECNSIFHYSDLRPTLENRFNRITLVNKLMTERVTIDTGLRFHNYKTNKCCEMSGLAIIELKRDGRSSSDFLGYLSDLRVFPASFSKYCIGMVVTDDSLPYNNFKPQILTLDKNYNIITSTYNF
jgi:hypothetical protein